MRTSVVLVVDSMRAVDVANGILNDHGAAKSPGRS
jgi:hypothetical protein